MTWGINISGHGDTPACSSSCWYGPAAGPSKSASYSGDLDVVAAQSVAFITESQAEEAAASTPAAGDETPEASVDQAETEAARE